MSGLLTEKQVLKKLDIPDFRSLPKDKVIAFVSLLDRMDPEVAKKALEQFPNFASTALELMNNYKEILGKALDLTCESSKATLDIYKQRMDSLTKMLDDDLSIDDKKYILEQMREITDAVSQKDTEIKKTTVKIVGIAGTVVLGIVAALGSVLGTNIGSSREDDEL